MMLAIWHIVSAVRVAVTYWVLKRVIQDIARDVEKWYTEGISVSRETQTFGG